MSVTLTCTGVQFPDTTVQTTAATPLSTVTYANRATLRTTTPSANLTSIAVEGLGVFTYYANNAEPDDDETCFVVSGSGGAWQLLSPSWDMVYANMEPDIEYLNNQVGVLTCCVFLGPGSTTLQPKLNLYATCCVSQPISIMSGSSFCSCASGTIGTWSTPIPGVLPTDIVNAYPLNYNSTSLCNGTYCSNIVGILPYTTIVPCAGYVEISMYDNNFGVCASTITPFYGTNTIWSINVLRYC